MGSLSLEEVSHRQTLLPLLLVLELGPEGGEI